MNLMKLEEPDNLEVPCFVEVRHQGL